MNESSEDKRIYSKISRVVRFFQHTRKSDFLFCTYDDSTIIRVVNEQVLRLTSDAGLTVRELLLSEDNAHAFPEEIKKHADAKPDGMILSNIDEIVYLKNKEMITGKLNPAVYLKNREIIFEINVLRKTFMDMEIPFLFWISKENVSLMTYFASSGNIRKDDDTGTVQLLEKPVDFDELVVYNLKEGEKAGSMSGISLFGFLQLIGGERKTCLIEISADGERLGFLYCYKGQIFDAVCGNLKGENAAYNLLAVDDVQIGLMNLPKKKYQRRIKQNLMPLLMEASRLKDEIKDSKNPKSDSKLSMDRAETETEAERETETETETETGTKTETETETYGVVDVKNGDTDLQPVIEMQSELAEINNFDPEKTDDGVLPVVSIDNHSESNDTLFMKGSNEMKIIQDGMEGLRDVEGFMAVGAFSPEGELIAEVNSAGLKIDELGALANGVLLKSQKATEMMGVGRGQMVHIEAPKAHIFVRCLNESTDFAATTAGRAHVHMMLIINREGNVALAKMKLSGAIQEIAAHLR